MQSSPILDILFLSAFILLCATWIAFALSMTLAPIGIAVAISESYIIIAVILGLVVNRERFVVHQRIGLITALCSALALAVITT